MKDRSGIFESDLGRDPRSERIFVIGTVTGALFVVLLWAAVSVVTEPSGRDGAGAETADVAVEGGRLPSTLPSNTSVLTRDQACRDLVAAQGGAVRAAERSLAQWRLHVRAMNQLVAGEITLAQASAFWDRTRVGAHRRLEAWAARSAALPDRATSCAGSGTADERGDCAQVAAARARQLRRAGTALATWARHVRHMEMLRHGHLDATVATRMWRNSWRTGVRQLERYDRAAISARTRC